MVNIQQEADFQSFLIKVSSQNIFSSLNCIWLGGGRVVRWCWVNVQCWGVLLIWTIVGHGPTALTVGAGWDVWTFFSFAYRFCVLAPSLWETARYRLKYCLKRPFNPKQPANQHIFISSHRRTFSPYLYLFPPMARHFHHTYIYSLAFKDITTLPLFIPPISEHLPLLYEIFYTISSSSRYITCSFTYIFPPWHCRTPSAFNCIYPPVAEHLVIHICLFPPTIQFFFFAFHMFSSHCRTS